MTQQSQQPEPFNPETANFDDLMDAANAQLTEGLNDLDPNASAAAPAPQDPPATPFRRVIDLGDGSGAQVFEGATQEELIEKLAAAQVHATRKIQDLSRAQQPKPQAPAEPTADEEFVLSQQFLQNPTKTFRKMFKDVTGLSVEEFNAERTRVNAQTKYQSEFNAGRDFAMAHPDYYASDKNNARIEKWLRVEGLDTTVPNLEKAYNDLTESGLLEAKPNTQAPNAAPAPQPVAQPRIADPAPRIVGQRRAASGLSQRGGSTVTRSQGPTEDELYKMPYEELARLAQEEASRQ